ncbi:MAG: HAMP domain-containing protein [Gammaproteobacteria bacterium]|nr:HAMP domain-containing protein [Gammaproteobacteria bacterium]
MSLARTQGFLFRKYAVYFVTLVSVALLASGCISLYVAYRENRAAQVALQHEKARAAADKIEQYIKEIEHQIGWTVLPPAVSVDRLNRQRRLDYLKLLRQVPAITEVAYLDPRGREQLRVSRLELDVVGSQRDFSHDPRFTATRAGQRYFGPVYFRKATEPYMAIALPLDRGVTVVEVNLKFVWDVVSNIRIGQAGHAYVVDAGGQLISHPDISLVLQKTNLAALPQVASALQHANENLPPVSTEHNAIDLQGNSVLTSSAAIATLGWIVFVEQPLAEALAPLYASALRSVVLLLLGLMLSVLAGVTLARRMVTPIRALQAGAEKIGAGALDHRIQVDTGDELEVLAEQFNRMATQLQASYADLENKVQDRTQQLELANRAKSRFLAAASHDLRQPMHALGLFVGQLHAMIQSPQARKIVDQIRASVEAMEQLLNALLDISKLDAGVLSPQLEDFPLNRLLQRMETHFAHTAQAKGLRWRIMPCRQVVRSDPLLLERIVMNLVANAVCYTTCGGIVIGCRRRGAYLRVEVWDSGPGIPQEKQREIFQEFIQLNNPQRDRGHGLGLGLAIVERLARLLDHRINLVSRLGHGSCFSIELPVGNTPQAQPPPRAQTSASNPLSGLFVVVIDDEILVRSGTEGVLRGWGCHVLSAGSGDELLALLAAHERTPDLIISDYRLRENENGIEVINRLRTHYATPISATLISGDTAPERLREARDSGYPLLHKPVSPAKLRAMLNYLLSEMGKPAEPPAEATIQL